MLTTSMCSLLHQTVTHVLFWASNTPKKALCFRKFHGSFVDHTLYLSKATCSTQKRCTQLKAKPQTTQTKFNFSCINPECLHVFSRLPTGFSLCNWGSFRLLPTLHSRTCKTHWARGAAHLHPMEQDHQVRSGEENVLRALWWPQSTYRNFKYISQGNSHTHKAEAVFLTSQ